MSEAAAIGGDPDERCHFFVKRKKRNCRMLVKPGKKFCGEHALDKDNPDFQNPNLSVKRIPCPYDPKHSCEETKLESHLKKCRAKPLPPPIYCEKGINGSFEEDSGDEKPLRIGTVSDEKLMAVIGTIERVYETIKEHFTERILTHPVVEEEMQDHPSFGPSVRKHLKQNSSLLGHLNEAELLKVN